MGNPDLTTACKEISREKDAMIFIVSVGGLWPLNTVAPLILTPVSFSCRLPELELRITSPARLIASAITSGKPSLKRQRRAWSSFHSCPSSLLMESLNRSQSLKKSITPRLMLLSEICFPASPIRIVGLLLIIPLLALVLFVDLPSILLSLFLI